ncbi:YagK/YfjJ domain-containing protein [Dongshaea marina]|uniref:YagK/YfjJ domain-containing protein n=1 Tax=Dongshaea marina TaxID=2047966 RepID=UPI000D3EA02B|nr:inovirus-type Gp2 protein [Dongshaea marina]
MAVTHEADLFDYRGWFWPVMSFSDGLRRSIMQRVIDQLEMMLLRYSRVLVVRFDLHLAEYSSNNGIISLFQARLSKRLKKKYGGEVGYAWVREQVNAIAQHYHYALMLNGHKVNYPSSLLEMVEEIWCALGNPKPYTPKNCYYLIHRQRDDEIKKVVYRLSYLAKNYSKRKRGKQVKDYQTSRLKSPA